LRTDLAETRHAPKVRPSRSRDVTRLLIVASVAPQDALRLIPLAEAARAAGYEPQIALITNPLGPSQDSALSRLAGSGLTLFRIDAPADRGVRAAFEQYRALSRIVRRAAPQIIHAVGLRAVLVAGAIARLKGLAVVHSPDLISQHLVRGAETSWGRRMVLATGLALVFGHRRAQVHVVTPDDRAALVDAHVLVARRSFLSRGTGVDLHHFYPRASEPAVDEPTIIALPPPDILGRDALRVVVASARRLKSQGLAARFVLIGGQDQDRISADSQKALQAWQDEGLVEWWELADNLAETLRRVDVFCVPVPASRGGAMGQLIAAAATGLTLVATDCGAFRDVIRHDLNGLLVPFGDTDAFEAACIKVVKDRAFRAQAAQRSREIATAEFGLDASITATLTMYQAALTPPARMRFFAREEI